MSTVKDICRFCLQEISYDEANQVDLNKLQNIVNKHNVLPKMEIELFRNHFICNSCIDNMRTLKTVVSDTFKSNTAILAEKTRKNLSVVNLKDLPRFSHVQGDFIVCRLCLKPTRQIAIYLYDNDRNLLPMSYVVQMLSYMKIFTQFDKTINPILCPKCWENIQVAYSFRKTFDKVTEKIYYYQAISKKIYIDMEDLQYVLEMWDQLGTCNIKQEVNIPIKQIKEETYELSISKIPLPKKRGRRPYKTKIMVPHPIKIKEEFDLERDSCSPPLPNLDNSADDYFSNNLNDNTDDLPDLTTSNKDQDSKNLKVADILEDQEKSININKNFKVPSQSKEKQDDGNADISDIIAQFENFLNPVEPEESKKPTSSNLSKGVDSTNIKIISTTRSKSHKEEKRIDEEKFSNKKESKHKASTNSQLIKGSINVSKTKVDNCITKKQDNAEILATSTSFPKRRGRFRTKIKASNVKIKEENEDLPGTILSKAEKTEKNALAKEEQKSSVQSFCNVFPQLAKKLKRKNNRIRYFTYLSCLDNMPLQERLLLLNPLSIAEQRGNKSEKEARKLKKLIKKQVKIKPNITLKALRRGIRHNIKKNIVAVNKDIKKMRKEQNEEVKDKEAEILKNEHKKNKIAVLKPNLSEEGMLKDSKEKIARNPIKDPLQIRKIRRKLKRRKALFSPRKTRLAAANETDTLPRTRFSVKKNNESRTGSNDLLILQREEVIKKRKIRIGQQRNKKVDTEVAPPSNYNPVEPSPTNTTALLGYKSPEISVERHPRLDRPIENNIHFNLPNNEIRIKKEIIEEEEVQIKREILSECESDEHYEDTTIETTTANLTNAAIDIMIDEQQCPNLQTFIKSEPVDSDYEVTHIEDNVEDEDDDQPPELEFQGPCYVPGAVSNFHIQNTFTVDDKRQLINTVEEKRHLFNILNNTFEDSRSSGNTEEDMRSILSGYSMKEIEYMSPRYIELLRLKALKAVRPQYTKPYDSFDQIIHGIGVADDKESVTKVPSTSTNLEQQSSTPKRVARKRRMTFPFENDTDSLPTIVDDKNVAENKKSLNRCKSKADDSKDPVVKKPRKTRVRKSLPEIRTARAQKRSFKGNSSQDVKEDRMEQPYVNPYNVEYKNLIVNITKCDNVIKKATTKSSQTNSGDVGKRYRYAKPELEYLTSCAKKTYSTSNPFKCKLCEYSSSVDKEAKLHIASHFFQCPYCSYRAVMKKQWICHIRCHVVQSDLDSSCPLCEKPLKRAVTCNKCRRFLHLKCLVVDRSKMILGCKHEPRRKMATPVKNQTSKASRSTSTKTTNRSNGGKATACTPSTSREVKKGLIDSIKLKF